MKDALDENQRHVGNFALDDIVHDLLGDNSASRPDPTVSR